jgi:DNA-binding response OmpR family regulator
VFWIVVTGQPETYLAKHAKDIPAMHVIVIDDDWRQCEIVKIKLQQSKGIQVTTATVAETGIQIANSHTPDLIILDIVMPDANGFDILSRLKSDNRTSRIPVVICSGYEDAETRNKASELQADYFLSKPLNSTELLKIIEEIRGA